MKISGERSMKKSDIKHQSLRWDELTPKAFLKLRKEAKGVCVLPVASIEQHGGHLPLGTDSWVAEEVCRRAGAIEPMMIFPVLRFGVNGEATAYPGAIALRTEVLFELLTNLCDEIARNGFNKILLYSTHGGNAYGLPFFVQQWATIPRDYMVYYFTFGYHLATPPRALTVSQQQRPSAHGGVFETSAVMSARPDTVCLDEQFPEEYAKKLGCLEHLMKLGIYTAVNYYSNFPNHWAGLPTGACPEAGEEILDERAQKLAEVVRAIKADTIAPRLMAEFRKRASAGGTMLIRHSRK